MARSVSLWFSSGGADGAAVLEELVGHGGDQPARAAGHHRGGEEPEGEERGVDLFFDMGGQVLRVECERRIFYPKRISFLFQWSNIVDHLI